MSSIFTNDQPLVSVICPAYNSGKYIADTLLSILKQDYFNIEIIVSDDCSVDNTVEVVKGLINEYPGKIRLNVNDKNLGITDNCNVALRMCKGDFVSFFAADDLMYAGKLTAQVELMLSDPSCSISYHAVDILDGDNNNSLIMTTGVGAAEYKSVFDIVRRGGLIGACSVMVRREAIPNTGFCADIPKVSDWLMQIEVALRGRVRRLDGVYAGYLRHSTGASRNTYETINEIKQTLAIFSNRFSDDPIITSIVTKAYNRYMLGEIARLYIKGDSVRLTESLTNGYCNSPLLKIIAYICLKFIFLNENRLVLSIYKKMHSAVK